MRGDKVETGCRQILKNFCSGREQMNQRGGRFGYDSKVYKKILHCLEGAWNNLFRGLFRKKDQLVN